MNAELLLQHYDRISDAPDAVARLRRLVLDLAVRGKLSDHLPAENNSAFAELRDKPFEIPTNWSWVQIGDTLDLFNGRAFKPTEWLASGLPIVRIQNLNDVNAPFNYCDPSSVNDRHVINTNAFLISWSGTPGTSFGAFIWKRGRAALNQHIFKCVQKTEDFFDSFLKIAINGRLDEMIAQAHGGVGLQHITKGKLERLVIPCPPLAEQHRIVAKVDELMALCDQLQVARERREATRDRLVSASLKRLSQPADTDVAFRAHAQFALNTLPRLTTRVAHVKHLRQAILSLAVRGKLTLNEQEPRHDSPTASELVRNFTQAHERNGGHKKGNASEATDGAHDLHKVELFPRDWEVTDLRTIVEPNRPITYGILMPGPDVHDGVPYVRVADFPHEKINLNTIRKTASDIESKYARARLKSGDILFSIRGTVGRVCTVPDELDGANITQDTARLSLQTGIHPNFLVWVLRSDMLQKRMRLCQKGVAVQGINIGDVRSLQIPLPPLVEQHRIVAKVDELMAVCDQLEARITEADTRGQRLLEAVLREALA